MRFAKSVIRARFALLASLLELAACSGGHQASKAPPVAPGAGADPYASFGPLEVGADFKSAFHKVSTAPFESRTHGGRFVEIWVNDVGLAAYQGEDELPVGTIIVKESWEPAQGRASDVAGPIFVMEKRAPGYSADHNDWHYEFHWASVPAKWAAKLGASQLYWRSPSKKVDYCWECHDNYEREIGLPAKGFRAWEGSGDGTSL